MTKKQITKILIEKIQLCLKTKRYSSIGIYNSLLIVISYKGSTMPLKTYNKYFSLLFDTELFNEIKEYLLKNNLLGGKKEWIKNIYKRFVLIVDIIVVNY